MTNAIALLVNEAVPHLQHAFGVGNEIPLSIRTLPEGTVKVALQLPKDFQGDPEAMLKSFNDTWWLSNCHRSEGCLVFDYEQEPL